MDFDLFSLLFLVIPVFIIFQIIKGLKKRARMKSMNYAWYRRSYAGCFVNGRPTCYACGNNRIHTKNLMQGTYLREHFCSQCGEALYYSEEGSRKL